MHTIWYVESHITYTTHTDSFILHHIYHNYLCTTPTTDTNMPPTCTPPRYTPTDPQTHTNDPRSHQGQPPCPGFRSSLASPGLEAQGSSGAALTNEDWGPRGRAGARGQACLSLGLWEAEPQGPRQGQRAGSWRVFVLVPTGHTRPPSQVCHDACTHPLRLPRAFPRFWPWFLFGI